MSKPLETQAILDALGHGVLVFDGQGNLVQSNTIAASILGRDLNLIQKQGWSVAAELFDTDLESSDLRLTTVKENALKSERPVRFKIYRSGMYIPCWAAAVNHEDGDVYLILTLDVPDWDVIAVILNQFRNEMHEAVSSTIGHVKLISRTMEQQEDDAATRKIARRIGGFTRLIDIHMSRAGRLITMLDRLQDIRTGKIRDAVREQRRKINFEDFFEDFLEELDETPLLDPESEEQDYRSRISSTISDAVLIDAAPVYLGYVLKETVRNALMYSMLATSVKVEATTKGDTIQIKVSDEGYGIRQTQHDSVFEPFKRARQPQIIAEFGYGLALHLCKHEIEAMQGTLWFDSEEQVGTTIHIQLPKWNPASST